MRAGEGHPVVGADRPGQAKLLEHALEDPERIGFLGAAERLAAEQVAAGEVGDRERVAVAVIGEHELTLEVGAPQIIGCGSLGERRAARAVQAGVRSIEHGNLLDEDTLKLMAEKGIWLSGQMLVDSTEAMDPKRREKRKPVIEGQTIVWPMAKRLGVKLAWGTDFLFEPELNAQQNAYILRLKPYFTPAELLKLVTSGNAELLALSGPRTPYEGRLGVVEQGALADLILVRGDPLADIDLIGDPARNFTVIMKDGVIVKSAAE